MKVIDASAWVEAWGTPLLREAGLDEAVVPGHFDAEVLHSARGLVRAKKLARFEGDDLITTTSIAPFLRIPAWELIEAAWTLAESVSGYDALYVALAMRENVPLLTADGRLARGARDLCEIELLEL
ncbi:MAG: type II toxin-antitoxin system VapC family toxin [Solirubrobacterales bacterium]|nr:type II toxin-antitoxin system VapC family toxin [Solirubrobacterales bacterium]